jgi:hypothetical protein
VWTLDFDDFNAQCAGNTQKFPLISIIRDELTGGGTNVTTTVILLLYVCCN